MEDKQVWDKVYIGSTKSLRFLLEAMLKISADHAKTIYHHHISMSPGQQQVYKFLSNPDAKSRKLLSKEIDLAKVRDTLKDYGVSFAFSEQKEGVELYFRTSDDPIVTRVFEKIFKDYSQRPEKMSQKMTVDPSKVHFEFRAKAAEASMAKQAKDFSRNQNMGEKKGRQYGK